MTSRMLAAAGGRYELNAPYASQPRSFDNYVLLTSSCLRRRLSPCCAHIVMGSLCSKSSSLSGGHRLIADSAAPPVGQERPDPRTAAAQAAEQRLKAVSHLPNLLQRISFVKKSLY